MSANQYWLISVPSDGSADNTWRTLQQRTTRDQDISINHKMSLPTMRVGTLDSLMSLSDDTAKLDTYVESITHKIERELREQGKGSEAPTINQTPVESYLTRFSWDEARYPVKSTLRELVDLIQQQVTRIDEELKAKTNVYNTIKSNLAAIARKQTGNLNTRGLGDVISKAKKDDIVDTENITTLLVVVPKPMYKDWNVSYEGLTQFVVPRSSKLLMEDQDFGLFRVMLFKRVVDEFKGKAREARFNVREVSFDPEEYRKEHEEATKLESDREREWMSLVRWCKTGYSECFVAWMHLKAIRLFVESVLRYGLPEKVNPLAMLLKPQKRCETKLRKTLLELYGHLQSDVYTDSGDAAPGSEFFPYVFIPIEVFAPER